MKDTSMTAADSTGSPSSALETGGKTKFGEKLLKKFGWKQGDGIGKTNQGIVDPIKASFKFDQTGVGFNLSDEFTVNWWEHLFNHTAKKIDKATKSPKAAQVKPVEEPAPAENRSPEKQGVNLNSNKSFYYSRFTKGSMLVNGETLPTEKPAVGREEATAAEEDSYDKKGKKIVSDEDLFKMCGGRTAHKGARHGIKMNGKLARIEEQEKQLALELEQRLEEKMRLKRRHEIQKNESAPTSDAIEPEKPTTGDEGGNNISTKSKKKKRKSELSDAGGGEDSEPAPEPEDEGVCIKEKKTKKKKKRRDDTTNDESI